MTNIEKYTSRLQRRKPQCAVAFGTSEDIPYLKNVWYKEGYMTVLQKAGILGKRYMDENHPQTVEQRNKKDGLAASV